LRILLIAMTNKNKNSTLTTKQLSFCSEYLVDLNATQAAIRAGYSGPNVRKTASDLLAKPDIQEEVARRMKLREKRTEITQDRVLAELANIAFFDIRKTVDQEGRPLPLNQLDNETARAIISADICKFGNAEVGIGEITKLRFSDKRAALVDIGKHLGMFKDKIEVTGENGAPINFAYDLSKMTTEELELLNKAVSIIKPENE
jgi:phage terminase small subunit